MPISKITQNKIVNLYKNNGYSAMQISEKLDISDSVVRYWLIKKKVQRRSISEAITNLYIIKFKKQQFKLKENLSKSDIELKITGVMLYWGEGAKLGNGVQFINSDPEMITIFLNFLRKVCGISEERVKVLLHMYMDQNEVELKKFWANKTRLPLKNFYKSQIHVGRVGSYKKKSQYGTLAINYSDKKLLKTILLWIDEYKQKLI